MKAIVKRLMALTPYRIVRDTGANRFQAIEGCLRSMRNRGFSPSVVFDGGAHLGVFSLAAKKIFPNAKFHLVEPQPSCGVPLRRLCEKNGFVLHECALGDSGGLIYMLDTRLPSTGAYIKMEPDAESVAVASSTLDGLFESCVTAGERVLLKLDLQGFELRALRGARVAMKSVEAILMEVSFYAQAYEPPISELVRFLDENEFELYDIASLSGRRRDNRLHQADLVFVRRGGRLLEDSSWE